MNILEEANNIIHGKRGEDYGHPYFNHTLTAQYWSVFLGQEITAEDVCFLNILQKIARANTSITRDTLVDMAGYSGNIEMVQEKREELARPNSTIGLPPVGLSDDGGK